MPTGYTAAIKDGITFKKFVMDCARAFGACIEMRDDSMDKPIPEAFNPSDYHAKALEKAKEELVAISVISIEEAEKIANAQYCERIVEYKEKIRENKALECQYLAMLKQVKDWVPPTAEHIGIKEFMIEQIESSIKFDCSGDYYQKALKEIKKLSGEEWKKNKTESIIRDINYHAEHNEEEKARAKTRTEWIKALRESLKGEKE